MAVFLVPVEKGVRIAVDKAIIFIGRHPDCDVVLTRSRKVSRKHCAIVQVNDRLVVRDLGSMNGIRVNGKRVRKEAPIRSGDEVTIGDVKYTLQSTKDAGRRKRKPAGVPEKPVVAADPVPDIDSDEQSMPSMEVPVPIVEDDDDEDPDVSLGHETPESVPVVEDLDEDDEEEDDDDDDEPYSSRLSDNEKEFTDSGSQVEIIPE